MPRNVLLDVDTGVDDALAIILAMHSPSIRLVGITTVSGNTGSDQAALNTRFLLRHFRDGEKVSVVVGARESIARGAPVRAANVHGGDGLGGVYDEFAKVHGGLDAPETTGMDAADFILEQARRHKRDLAVVATGPVTNLALALERDRASFLQIGDVLVMGGAIDVRGNVRELVEFNASCDPEALSSVLQSGVRVTLFPLDVTRQVRLTAASLNEQKAVAVEELALIRRLTRHYMEFYRLQYGIGGAICTMPFLSATSFDRICSDSGGES